MRKSGLLGVKPVGKALVGGGVSFRLSAVVKITFTTTVYKVVGLYQLTSRFIRLLIHPINSLFYLVNFQFIPTKHTTYNKLQLSYLNTCY
jgi:hypothetical protein